MSGNFYLGTSGFAYDEWKHGVFYPEGLKNREMLSYYSSQLSSVEINYTFRRFPTEKSLTTRSSRSPRRSATGWGVCSSNALRRCSTGAS